MVFELRRDEPLGVEHALFAQVVLRDLTKIGFGDFDVVAVDRVEADAEVGDAGALAFGLLQASDVAFGVGGKQPQLVQFRVGSGPNHAALG